MQGSRTEFPNCYVITFIIIVILRFVTKNQLVVTRTIFIVVFYDESLLSTTHKKKTPKFTVSTYFFARDKITSKKTFTDLNLNGNIPLKRFGIQNF